MTAFVLDTSRPSSPTDVDTMTLYSPPRKPSSRATCSFCFRPPLDCPTSRATLAPSTAEILDTSISQVSLYWAKTMTLASGSEFTVLLTMDMTRETFECSTLDLSMMDLTPTNSGRLTISLALLPPSFWSASSSILRR